MAANPHRGLIILGETPRQALRARNQAYEAAVTTGRRLMNWRPSQSGPNADQVYSLQDLRARSRDSKRNNGWIAHGIDTIVSDEIGTGIVSRSRCSNKEFRLAADALWPRWVKTADADGVLDYYGLLSSIARSRIESGEAFIRFRPRRMADGLAVPLQLQVIEGDFCPHTYYVPLKDGRQVKAGIEFTSFGQKKAYWMYKGHPGEYDGTIDATMLVSVPSQSILHHYLPLRPGSLRGVPWTTQALIKAKDFDEYDDAELIRKKSRASYTGAIRRPDYGEDDYKFDPFTGEALTRDANAVAVMNVEPGSMPNLLPGEDITLFEGDPAGQGYADFCHQQILGLAAGMNLPYELVSGDMSKVNDRIMRVILNQYHRQIEQWQWNLTIHQVCQPVWERVIETAVLSGALDAPDFEENRDDYLAVEHRTPGWPYIHPLQDVQAKRLAVRSGFSSRSAAVAETGWDSGDIDTQNAEDNARADDLDLVYESDGRQSNSGGEQEEDPPDPAVRNAAQIEQLLRNQERLFDLLTNQKPPEDPPPQPIEVTVINDNNRLVMKRQIIRDPETGGWIINETPVDPAPPSE